MKSWAKSLCVLCVLCGSALRVFSLDREVFSFTNYNLNLQVDPVQHRLGVRGKMTLRNDAATPQKIAVLQISSSLNWRSIKAGDKALQFVTQPYTSDIDHSGGLSEAIVTLPQAVEPHATVELEIGYEGVILQDATRLTRIGTPDELARSTDWDQIDTSFTALRGAGYVAWYPIATDVANLSDGNSLFEVLARWKAREAGSTMHLQIGVTTFGTDRSPGIFLNAAKCPMSAVDAASAQHVSASCPDDSLRFDLPILVIADYQILEKPGVEVRYLRGHDAGAAEAADAAEKIAPFIAGWFGAPREKKASTADLPDPNLAPFESSALLLTPLASTNSSRAALAAAHQLTHASFLSNRPWIEEGLAHFAQALYLEQQKGRQAALDYMALHRSALGQMEPSSEAPTADDDANRALVNTTNEALSRSKSMYVWWMLRDMVGDAALKKALAAYRPEQDKEPSYMPRLVSAQTQRDLEWFFDDWVYRDRGLPDFKVESAFSRSTMTKTYVVAVTVENLGTAGAEVPVIVKFAGGQVAKRLEVRAKSKATIRIETPAAAQEIQVNDGGVPESDSTNNTFKVAAPQL